MKYKVNSQFVVPKRLGTSGLNNSHSRIWCMKWHLCSFPLKVQVLSHKSVLIVYDVSGVGLNFRLGVSPLLFNTAENQDLMKK